MIAGVFLCPSMPPHDLSKRMTKKKSPLSDEDRALWKSVSALIEPHKKTDIHRRKRNFKKDENSASPAVVKAITKAAAKPAGKKKWEALPHQPASATGKKSITTHELPAIADDIARQLKSKKRGIDARIDLHGMTQDVAHRKAIAFVNASLARHLKTILIITGKGTASTSEGVLHKNLPRWLSASPALSRHILGISPAPTHLGGHGAFVIHLRQH